MKFKYAVALLKGGEEKILGIFNTKDEADKFGNSNKLPSDAGLQYCFAANFKGAVPSGSVKVYDYYNVQLRYGT